METGSPAQQNSHFKLSVAVLAPLLAVPALWLLVLGVQIVLRPAGIGHEVFNPAVPLVGPYTPEELKRAETSVAGLLPPEKLIAGLSRQEVETLAEGRRMMERVKEDVWERRKAERLGQAQGRVPTGWGLIGLGTVLLGLWGWALWGMRRRFSSILR